MWLEHLLFGARPKARRPLRGTRECKYFQSLLYTARTAAKCGRLLESPFIDNTERKDQRGKEKQKESLYNLEFRSFFELKNIGTAISRQEQIRNDSQAARIAFQSRDWGEWETRSIRKEDKSERWMPRLSGGEEGRGKLRKGSGNCKQVLIRAYPNGATQQVEDLLPSQMERTRGTETS